MTRQSACLRNAVIHLLRELMTISPLVLHSRQGNVRSCSWPQRKQGIQRNAPLLPAVNRVRMNPRQRTLKLMQCGASSRAIEMASRFTSPLDTLPWAWSASALIPSMLIYSHADTEMKREAIEITTDANYPLRRTQWFNGATLDNDTVKML
jgi:hypothetical protein